MFGKVKVKLSKDHRWEEHSTPKRAPTKWSKILVSLLDLFGPLWNIDKAAMFGQFWSKMDHVWAIHLYIFSQHIEAHSA